jgi:hypothetical protein
VPPPFYIRCNAEVEEEEDAVLDHNQGVTAFHPFGGAYEFFANKECDGESVLTLAYVRLVATVVAERNGVPWRPSQ